MLLLGIMILPPPHVDEEGVRGPSRHWCGHIISQLTSILSLFLADFIQNELGFPPDAVLLLVTSFTL